MQTVGLLRPAPSEAVLKDIVDKIFPGEHIITRARKALRITRPNSKQPLEIDLWIPSLKLGFEFQDPHHYKTIWYSHYPLKLIKEIDAFKKKIVEERGETLVQVPCWWDGSRDSLVATIKVARPDLLRHLSPSCPAISDIPPSNFFKSESVPDVGELMHPSFLFKHDINNNLWWMGEKYDGMRCCWNPTKANLYSRSGALITLPVSFERHMPSVFLDGEVWFGRASFQEATKLNPRFKILDVDWPSFRIVAFDNPERFMNELPFEERYKSLLVIDASHPCIVIVSRVYVGNKAKIKVLVQQIMQNGGEGAILRQQKSKYEHGRSDALRKIKMDRDAEAIVVEKMKLSEELLLQLADGTLFKVPTPNSADIDGPLPKKGDVVTFNFKRFISGDLPANPSIQRVRTDLKWSEVLKNAKRDELFNLSKHLDYSRRWSGTKKDMRILFAKFARDNDFDPLIPENWYKVHRDDVLAVKGATGMINIHFNGSLVKALLSLFPDIGLVEGNFDRLPLKYWQHPQNIRKHFEQFAKESGFDPLIAENWYLNFPTRRETMMVATKKAWAIARNISASIVKAFPDVHFDVSRFPARTPHNYWNNPESIRNHFEQLATERGFDPLVAENWYNFPFHQAKSARAIAKSGSSYSTALQKSFPEVHFDKDRFRKQNNFRNSPEHLRSYFEKLAYKKGFDPLVAENWYRFPFDVKVYSIR